MTLQECYAAMGGDYTGVMGRLMQEERVTRFLRKFKEDDMMGPLELAFATSDYEEAFRAAHNLKGVCQNLGLERLAVSSSNLCETVRGGEPTEDITPLLMKVRQDYAVTMDALEML